MLKTDTLEFAQDIKEVNYSEIPVIDRDSAILLGNREMGSIPEYVSQFEISPLYSQINYQSAPVRVSPLATPTCLSGSRTARAASRRTPW